jgi:hypothetical protein
VVAGDVVLEQDAVAAATTWRALAALFILASEAMPAVIWPDSVSWARRRQSSCMVVTSASILASRYWTSWKLASGVPNCSRSRT